MAWNIFKNAIRSLVKDIKYTGINVLGLTIGITCSLFLLIYILHEISYDKYHTNASNIYRIISHIQAPENITTWPVTQTPLAPELKENHPEIKNAVRFFSTDPAIYKNADRQFSENRIFRADSTVFEMFNYEFKAGNRTTALDHPFSIVLTEALAKKYFDEITSALDQTLQNQDGEVYKVTGVIADVPLNSHFLFDALVSTGSDERTQGSWGGFGAYTYIQLPENYNVSQLDPILERIIKQRVNPVFDQYDLKLSYDLQKITDIHLHSKIQHEAEAGGDISYIYIFGAVAIFMLVIASINYINLATARSLTRTKEVGIRKVLGSNRVQLIIQFIAESLTITVIALVISLMAVYTLLQEFNTLANKQFNFSHIFQPAVLFAILAIVVFVGVVGGSYPAFYLSAFSPVNVLKGKFSAKGANILTRKVLVVFQFAVSIFMLVSTFVVYSQLQFLRNKDLGFESEKIIKITLKEEAMLQKASALVELWRQTSGVKDIALAYNSPGERTPKAVFSIEDNAGKLNNRTINYFGADYDFIPTLGMKIVQGRNFSRDIASDKTSAVLVNEAMVKKLGWEDPLGKKVVLENKDIGFRRERIVIGVVNDFHQSSLYSYIEPLIIEFNAFNRNIFVRLEDRLVKNNLSTIEQGWDSIFPDHSFDYVFLDQEFNSQYQADEKRALVFTLLSILTVFISCLGLFGLTAFTTEQRTKEIGIRKVVGASVANLVILVSKEFVFLVGIGLILAFPLAYYFTSDWLQHFAYRIELNGEWSTVLLTTLLIFVVMFLTIGFHVLRAATCNPVRTLRSE